VGATKAVDRAVTATSALTAAVPDALQTVNANVCRLSIVALQLRVRVPGAARHRGVPEYCDL